MLNTFTLCLVDKRLQGDSAPDATRSSRSWTCPSDAVKTRP